MIWNGKSVARVVAIAFIGVILQLTTVSQVTVLGATADLTPLLTASIGLLGGSVAGASFGFGVGLLLDLLLAQPLGLGSMALLICGYASGRLRELRDPAHALAPIAVGAAATALATTLFALLQVLTGLGVTLSFGFGRELLGGIILNTLIALPVYALCRRVLAPYLPDDPRRRRRRAYTTGGLSPLSRA